MKLCKLKLKNLNSFREEVDIDFEDPLLADASLVAITGPTGAGKTTLLDAICVALYDKTPRLSGTGSQNPNHLISHGEKVGFAEVHFIANNTRYIATWSAKQGSSRKGQLRYAEGDKLISDKLSSRGKSLGSSEKTVSQEVESILGLDFAAFRRSVMLAQGEFAAFLKASKEDRRTILEATAGIHIYDVLRQLLNDKIREVEEASADVLARLDKIPEASLEQLKGAEAELNGLKEESEILGVQSQRIQEEKQREVERKEDFERLQSSEKRQTELTNQQSEIDDLQAELENAQRAERLRPEKQAYSTAKSDFETAEKALDTATTEKTEAEKQVETDQADFDEKEESYQTAATEHTEKTAIYTAAKLDVARAADQFAEADDRTPKLTDLDNQIKTLSDELTNKETERTELQEQIKDTETFLDENHLPSNRQQRLTDATSLLTHLNLQENQLETALATKVQHEKTVVSSKGKVKELSKASEKRLLEKTDAETALQSADAKLKRLRTAGTQNEWNARKQQATKAQPIAQKYEAVQDDLRYTENQRDDLENTLSALETELQQIESELAAQAEACQRAEASVQRCEDALESARLANPINQLRQHLHTGEPCLVCGATEHPYAGKVESEDDDRLQNAENALKDARTETKTAQDQMQALKVKQGQTQQNKRNTDQQIKDCESEIETLQDEKVEHLAAWQKIYPTDDVSSEWVAAQIKKADSAIAALGEADQAQTAASHAYDMVAQQLETCERDFAREKKSLEDIEKQLQDAVNTIADLQADIKSTEDQFWGLLPETFHGVAPNMAVDQFDNKIEEVAAYKDKLNTAKTNLKLLDTKIETEQNNLENLQQNRDDLQDEIDEYRHQGKGLLDAVREKTDGLETKDKIDAAINQLEADLKAKEEARDEANNRLQESQKLLTQKQTAHEHCEGQYEESTEKFETARDAYFNKLEDTGFDSPEAHDDAFRDDAQMQEFADQIDAHEGKKRQLALDITELRTRFEETPFDPEALARIEMKMKEIQAQLQEKLKGIGTQQKVIDDLKKHLEQREALGEEVAAAQQELERWQRLYEVMPRSELRDFALEIMFKQMGNLANVQLDYLTSERYQLKVESIGNLSVIDRWNANEERPVETLSGGESFLTSLALALALADLSRGRAQLNSLFLDEGFGTLDAETLDTAIAALEGLRMQGRSIFLISHVQELTRRIPVKINVRKRGDGSSSVQIQG